MGGAAQTTWLRCPLQRGHCNAVKDLLLKLGARQDQKECANPAAPALFVGNVALRANDGAGWRKMQSSLTKAASYGKPEETARLSMEN